MFDPGRLNGLFPPITTPFRGRGIDAGALADNIGRFVDKGATGVVTLGSTGEAPLLDIEEKESIWKTARAAIPGEGLVIAGCGAQSTKATQDLCERAAGSGADLALVLTPFFFGMQMDDDALGAHFQAVADRSPIPVLLYSVPKFTHLSISSDLVVTLSHHENIVGFKDSSGNIDLIRSVIAEAEEAFCVLSGHALTFYQALCEGACGGILAAANVLFEPMHAIHVGVQSGEKDRAALMQRRIESSIGAVMSGGVPGIKRAVDLRGLHGGPPRPPLLPAPEELGSLLDRILEELVSSEILPAKAL